MIRAAIYNASTGVIMQMMAGDQDGILAALPEGMSAAVAPDEVSDDTHYIRGGMYREYPPRPSPTAVWDSATFAWVDAAP